MRPGRLDRPGSQPSTWGLRRNTQARRVLQNFSDGASRAARASRRDAARCPSVWASGTPSASQRRANAATTATTGMHCATGGRSLHDDAASFGNYPLHVGGRLHVPLLRDLG